MYSEKRNLNRIKTYRFCCPFVPILRFRLPEARV